MITTLLISALALRSPGAATVMNVGNVAPRVLAVTIRTGQRETQVLRPYVPMPGDDVQTTMISYIPGLIDTMELFRNGESVGYISGPDRNWLKPHDRMLGHNLALPDDLTGVVSWLNPRGITPTIETIWRKSKPVDWVQGPYQGFALEHTLYLKLSEPLATGREYSLDLSRVSADLPSYTFKYNFSRMRSEAIHVNQIGFHPLDPGKRAFVSVWAGTGGGLELASRQEFSIVDDRTGRTVFRGSSTLAKPASGQDSFRSGQNFAYSPTYHLDFGSLSRVGTYRVVLSGVGTSYPFTISEDVYLEPFRTSMKGFLNHRSGMELGAPFTEFERPRAMHPDDGQVVRTTGVSFVDSFNGLSLRGDGGFPQMVAQMTSEVLLEAWGGYMDAGDWDRHVGHLAATRLQLELLEMFPEKMGQVRLDLPDSERFDTLPDILNEALWNIDLYRRLQMPNGAIRGGIESGEHPRKGDTSWLETLPVFAYAPDPYASYIAAGVAARASFILNGLGQTDLADQYEDMAVRAFAWAETEMPSYRNDPTLSPEVIHPIVDERNLAALELYRLTEEASYNRIFRMESVLREEGGALFQWNVALQRDAGFLYARLPETLADSVWRTRAVNEVKRDGDEAIWVKNFNAWNITYPNRYQPLHLGFYSSGRGLVEPIRAHFLTGELKYLEAVIQGNLFSSGANPMNLVMTTGVGSHPIRHPLHIDSAVTGQPAPAGITPFGNWDSGDPVNQNAGWTWPYQWVHPYAGTTPTPWSWPSAENYFDYGGHPLTNEHTITATMGPKSYAWGYLYGCPR